jgi:lipopolysaccharide export system protein LptC
MAGQDSPQEPKNGQPKERQPKERLGLIGAAGDDAVRVVTHGYSKFVRLMRFVLPLLALVIVGLVMSWPKVEETMKTIPHEAGMPQSVAENELVEPRYEGTDEKNQPFAVTAHRAIQSGQDPDVVLLELPQGESTMNDGKAVKISADKGQYQQKAQKLLLEGNVTLDQASAYEFRTDKLLVYLKYREVWSDAKVTGKGPAGTLEASGLHATGENNLLIFTGPVKLVLTGSVKGL